MSQVLLMWLVFYALLACLGPYLTIRGVQKLSSGQSLIGMIIYAFAFREAPADIAGASQGMLSESFAWYIVAAMLVIGHLVGWLIANRPLAARANRAAPQ